MMQVFLELKIMTTAVIKTADFVKVKGLFAGLYSLFSVCHCCHCMIYCNLGSVSYEQ